MKSRMIMLNARAYNVEDRQTKEVNKGLTVVFYPVDNLNPKENTTSKYVPMDKGSFPINGSLPYEMQDKVVSVPALYDCTMEMRASKDGKAQLTIVDFNYISNLTTAESKPAK